MERIERGRARHAFDRGLSSRSLVSVRGVGMRVIKCAKCGKETEAKGNSQKYCPECGYQVRIERNHERIEARAAMFHDALKAARKSGKTPIRTRFAGVRHIKCEKCGKEVSVPRHAGHAKYCPTCSQESYRESHKRSKERCALKITAVCEVCGNEFSYVFKGGHRQTCDVCREMERTRARRPDLFGKQKKDVKKEPVPSIADLAAAAKAKGMSYGQYKAWLYIESQKKKA